MTQLSWHHPPPTRCNRAFPEVLTQDCQPSHLVLVEPDFQVTWDGISLTPVWWGAEAQGSPVVAAQ